MYMLRGAEQTSRSASGSLEVLVANGDDLVV